MTIELARIKNSQQLILNSQELKKTKVGKSFNYHYNFWMSRRIYGADNILLQISNSKKLLRLVSYYRNYLFTFII